MMLVCTECGEVYPHGMCDVCGAQSNELAKPEILWRVGAQCDCGKEGCGGTLVEAVVLPKTVAEKQLRDECDADAIRDWLSDRDEPCPDGVRLGEHVANVVSGLAAQVVAGVETAAVVRAIERLVAIDPRNLTPMIVGPSDANLNLWQISIGDEFGDEAYPGQTLRAALEAAVAALEGGS